jgi:hypothetical protein
MSDPLPQDPPPRAWWAAAGGWLRQNLLQLPTLLVGVATLLGVSTLSSRMSTSEMLLNQIENLQKDESLPRNMSILAIEHTLSSRSPLEGVHHDLLLTHVLGEVLMHDKAKGGLLGENGEAGRQRLAQIHRILLASIRDLNPRCAAGFATLADASAGPGHELDFRSSRDEVDPSERLARVIASPACRQAAALGFWTGWWPGKAAHDEVLRTSVQRLAAITPTAPAAAQLPLSSLITTSPVANQAGGEAIDLEGLSEDEIRSASEIVAGAVVLDQQKRMVAEKHGKLPDLPHVFIHYDDRALEQPLQAVARQLSGRGFFVDRTLRYVAPDAKACAQRSQVKLFHEGDRPVAEALVAALAEALVAAANQAESDAGQAVPKAVWAIDPANPQDPPAGIADLSTWSLASKVPRGQLELWLISQGCAAGTL